MFRANLLILTGAALVSACAAPREAPRSTSEPALNVADARCSDGAIAVDTAFPAGALASCEIRSDGRITIVLSPEDEPPINCSAWYAFRVHSSAPRDVRIELDYTACGHRYWPKTSTGDGVWTQLDPDRVKVFRRALPNGREAESRSAMLSLTIGPEPIFVAAQEIFVPATYDAWLDGVENNPNVSRFELGRSAEGRLIEAITIGNSQAKEQVVLVGRQHPPEVTGAFAMLPFMETLMEDTALATRFRERFLVTAVPMLNPDGVVRGFWRHNTGGVDLNRDWGPFTQPETQLMRDMLAAMESNPEQELRVLLDFHSTNRDVFYTIPDELPTNPELFTRNWLARYQDRMPGYEVDRDARHDPARPISKGYSYEAFGIPAITFEIGDNTDRELIKRIGRESAIALMEELLATPAS